MNNIPRNIFLVYRNDYHFIGNAYECADIVNTCPKYIRRSDNSSCLNGWLIKRILLQKYIYCIDNCKGHYESDDPKDLQDKVWLAPNTIKQYCISKTELAGTKFYCKKITVETNKPFMVSKYYG